MVLEILRRSGLSHFSQQTELDGKTKTIEFEWIERDQFWMPHIGDENGEPLACGIRLVADWPLPMHDVGVLPGQLIAMEIAETAKKALRYLSNKTNI